MKIKQILQEAPVSGLHRMKKGKEIRVPVKNMMVNVFVEAEHLQKFRDLYVEQLLNNPTIFTTNRRGSLSIHWDNITRDVAKDPEALHFLSSIKYKIIREAVKQGIDKEVASGDIHDYHVVRAMMEAIMTPITRKKVKQLFLDKQKERYQKYMTPIASAMREWRAEYNLSDRQINQILQIHHILDLS